MTTPNGIRVEAIEPGVVKLEILNEGKVLGTAIFDAVGAIQVAQSILSQAAEILRTLATRARIEKRRNGGAPLTVDMPGEAETKVDRRLDLSDRRILTASEIAAQGNDPLIKSSS